jgi:hypothetical protein
MALRECSNCHRTVNVVGPAHRRASLPGRATLCPACATRLNSVRLVGFGLPVRPL